jgi:hypothetical protein
MRRATSTGSWGLLFFLATGCATIIHEAVQRDMDEALHETGAIGGVIGDHDEPPRVCPPDKIQNEDCRVIPCKVTCEAPKSPPR